MKQIIIKILIMSFNFKNHFNLVLLLIYLFFTNCQLKEPTKNHGIAFLENRSEKLIVNKTNKNDVLNIIGHPHSSSLDDNQTWIYLERTLNKGKFHKLGQHVLTKNNTLVLYFDKYEYYMGFPRDLERRLCHCWRATVCEGIHENPELKSYHP